MGKKVVVKRTSEGNAYGEYCRVIWPDDGSNGIYECALKKDNPSWKEVMEDE